MPAALDVFADDGVGRIDALVNTTSFAMGDVNADGPTAAGWSVAAFARLDVPVVQAIASSMTQAQWAASERGLNPLDTAMNVALPEFDGRIVSVPMSFKDERDETAYAPLPDRVRRVAGIVARQVALRRTAPADKRIAFLFTNSSSKASQIGNAVGLDSPASLLALLRAMQAQGYRIDGLPESGDALIHALIDRGAYDEDYLSAAQLEQAIATVPAARYAAWFSDLPAPLQDKMRQRWGDAPGNAYVHDGKLVFAGMEYGNAFVALQPPRGYGMDPDAIYHTPTCRPRTTTTRSTAGCATNGARTPSSTSASTARWNGCRARAWAYRRPVSPTRCWAICRCSTRSSSTIRAKARRPSAARTRSSSTT